MSLLMDALKRAETAKQEAARAQFGIAPATSPESTLSLGRRGGDTGSRDQRQHDRTREHDS